MKFYEIEHFLTAPRAKGRLNSMLRLGILILQDQHILHFYPEHSNYLH